jgi:hypothetical protein
MEVKVMEKNSGPGIDYSGGGLVNRDNKTGIHYGVISQNEVLQAWADSSEARFPCEDCEYNVDNEGCDDCMDCEPLEYTYDDEGYVCQQSADDPDIFIIKSPYYTFCGYCSPCAPGAGYLMDYYKPKKNTLGADYYKEYAEMKGYIKSYCFGHNWFDDNKAPYPVYDVKTNLEVKAS